MTELLSQNLMLILNSVLLGLYFPVLFLGIYRVFIAKHKKRSFLLQFFGIVSIISSIEMSLQIYQVIKDTQHSSPNIPILISINIYAIAFETAAMFSLSDYWGDTSEILTKQSTQEQLQNEHHRTRFTVLGVWLLVFSAFIGYAFSTHDITRGDVIFQVLAQGCQGLGVALSLWANVMQIVKGYKMSSVLNRYQSWVSSLSIHKLQFCSLYLVSSILNLLRSLFLITIVLLLQFDDDSEWEYYFWLFIYIYSFSNLPILVIYLLGFSTKSEEIQLQTILLEDTHSSSQSRRETELSPSRSSRSSRSVQI